MFSPVRWNLALFYVLLFHIGSMTGHMLGGFGWSVAEMVARYGIAIMNALICAAIVKQRFSRERFPTISWA